MIKPEKCIAVPEKLLVVNVPGVDRSTSGKKGSLEHVPSLNTRKDVMKREQQNEEGSTIYFTYIFIFSFSILLSTRCFVELCKKSFMRIATDFLAQNRERMEVLEHL